MAISIHAITDEHVSKILEACGDWEELAQYGPPYWRPRSPAELRRKIVAGAGPQHATEYHFVVVDDGELTGECSLHAIDWRNRVAQIGVCIWDPGDRRKGCGRSAVQFATDWGFGYLDLARLEAWIVDGNDPSLALFERLGFTYEATLLGRYLHAGVRRSMHVLALTAST